MKLSPLAVAAVVLLVLSVALAVLGMASIDQSSEPNAAGHSLPLGVAMLGMGVVFLLSAVGCGIGYFSVRR